MVLSDSINILKNKKEELLLQKERIIQLELNNMIKNCHDIYGDDLPSFLFPFILKKLEFLLDSNDFSCFTKEEIKKRKMFNSIVRKVGPSFLKTKQVFEDREDLLGLEKGTLGNLTIPDSPVIFVANHSFRDDILGTILATDRHAYVMFASLPQFYNTIDGLLLYGNGVVLVNRKIKENKKMSLEKSKMVLKNGASLIIFPEGVWNKSPNSLCLPLWNGVYRIARETDAKIVPIIHYIGDSTYSLDKKDNSFHTVIDDPISTNNLSQKELLDKIRDSFSTWTYLMMEKYGKTTYNDLINNGNSQKKWEEILFARVNTADKYDFEIETSADYHSKDIVSTYEAFLPITNININPHNVKDSLYAKKLVKEYKDNDYQHRF